jgi:hypothetical protein
MVTDPVPKIGRLRTEYEKSNGLRGLALPDDDRFLRAARCIEEALATEEVAPVRKACGMFLASAAEFYGVAVPAVRVLRARPIRVREGDWGVELFGDYHFDEKLIRVWMRTAIEKRVTSFGTFFATLTHEFCHHLDRERFGFSQTPHTRGFFERGAVLHHHARATPAARVGSVRGRAMADRLGEDESGRVKNLVLDWALSVTLGSEGGSGYERARIFADCRDRISPDCARASGTDRHELARRRSRRVDSGLGQLGRPRCHGVFVVRRVPYRTEGAAEGMNDVGGEPALVDA